MLPTTDDRQTDGRQHIANVNVSSRSLKTTRRWAERGTVRMPTGTYNRWGAHWRHLANTTESTVCGGDAASCKITLTISGHGVITESAAVASFDSIFQMYLRRLNHIWYTVRTQFNWVAAINSLLLSLLCRILNMVFIFNHYGRPME